MERPEIVIGLVGALGADLPAVSNKVQQVLSRVGYTSEEIRLSRLLTDYPKPTPFNVNLEETPREKYLDTYMTAGNELRAAMERGDAMALLAIVRIRELREKKQGDTNEPILNHAFILRSLKHSDEVKTLRAVYGNSFFLISAYSPKKQRQDAEARRIAESNSVFNKERHGAVALGLLERDEEETDNTYGQQVRRTFWRGDGYIDASSTNVDNELNRILEIWFDHPYHTPTRDEYLMFCARAASYRSASMGRQVGAIIATQDGSIIATGTNEVPKALGGQYWDGDNPDVRDHQQGYDTSDTMRRGLLENLLNVLGKLGYLSEEKANINVHQLVENLLYGVDKTLMDSTEFSALTEYQRPIHAEMSAIVDAARRGVPVDGATLFSTTFPCHGCARHIVGAGIRRVVYIEPYAKSLVSTLYPDSISIDDPRPDSTHVQFVPFVGLAPRRYMELFEMGKRKDDHGQVLNWNPLQASPRIGGWEHRLSSANEQKYLTLYSQWRARFLEENASPMGNNIVGDDT